MLEDNFILGKISLVFKIAESHKAPLRKCVPRKKLVNMNVVVPSRCANKSLPSRCANMNVLEA